MRTLPELILDNLHRGCGQFTIETTDLCQRDCHGAIMDTKIGANRVVIIMRFSGGNFPAHRTITHEKPYGAMVSHVIGAIAKFREEVEKDLEEGNATNTNGQDYGRWRVISPFKTFTHAIDFFGDGSLYLVNTPGHYPGHISALARVSSSFNTEDREEGGTYVFLGGDCCHNRQCYVPGGTQRKLSGKIQWDVEKARESVGRVSMLCGICQGRFSEGSANGDVVDLNVNAKAEVRANQEGEGGDVRDVVVILAHEAERLEEGMPLFPQDLGEWAVHRARKERLRGER